MFGISCWHLLRERNVELFGRAAKLALIVAVPATLIQLSVGNRFGEAVTSAQGMKIAASEAQWNTCEPCGFSLFQIGGFSEQDETPSFSITIPRLLSWMATGSFRRQGRGPQPAADSRSSGQYGRGNYMPRRQADVLVDAGDGDARGGDVPDRRASARGCTASGSCTRRGGSCGSRWWRSPFPYIAATAGWILTEMGRQPWIVQNLLKTSDAVSPSLSTATVATSLTVFAAAVPRARRRRLRPDAPLRPLDPPGRRGRRVGAAGVRAEPGGA